MQAFTAQVSKLGLPNVASGASFQQSVRDLNVFSNNLLNSYEKIGNAGIGVSQCNAAILACTTTSNNGAPSYGNFNPFVNQNYTRPREVGVQANYRF